RQFFWETRLEVIPISRRSCYIGQLDDVAVAILVALVCLWDSRPTHHDHGVVLGWFEAYKRILEAFDLVVEIDPVIAGRLEVALQVEIRTIARPPGIRFFKPGRNVLQERGAVSPPEVIVIVLCHQAQCTVPFTMPRPGDGLP